MELYRIESDTLCRTGSREKFNRILYGGHDRDSETGRFFTFAGDTPVFMGASSDYRKDTWCYQAKNGVLLSGLALTPGHVENEVRDIFSQWFHEAGDITVRWHHGWLDYELTQFSSYFPDVRVKIRILPLDPDDGFLVRYDITSDQRVIWCAGFGGITSFFGRFEYHHSARRDFSPEDAKDNLVRLEDGFASLAGPGNVTMLIGDNFGAEYSADAPEAMCERFPARFLSGHEGEPRIIKLKRVIDVRHPLHGSLIVLRDGTPERLRELLNDPGLAGRLRARIREKYASVSFRSPDPRLNISVPDTLIALDASFHGSTFYHGAVGYHAPFLGWRGWYAPSLAGWHERVRTAILSHFETILRSDGPEKVWYDGADRPDLDHEGTQYHHLENTHGRLTALLHKDDIYDMQEVALDMTLHYFDASGDLTTASAVYERILELLDWQTRILDPDDDGLYQNFLNTWISDGHSYNGAGCAQASCYNLRACLRTAALGKKLGRNVDALLARAEKIRSAIQKRLWQEEPGVLAESVDTIGNGLVHPSPELSTVYLAVECGALTQDQARRSLLWVRDNIRKVTTRGSHRGVLYYSSQWLPKKYSTLGLFPAENAALALAFFKTGMQAEALEILSGLADVFELSPYPGSITHVAASSGASDSGDIDFTDVSSCWLRLLFEGLWGVSLEALDDRMTIAPNIPDAWQDASLTLPAVSLDLARDPLCDTLRIQTDRAEKKTVVLPLRGPGIEQVLLNGRSIGFELVHGAERDGIRVETALRGNLEFKFFYTENGEPCPEPVPFEEEAPARGVMEMTDISSFFNDSLTGVHSHKFLSPRPEGYSIGLRINGRYAWEWNHYGHNALHVDDSLLRQADGVFSIPSGIPFRTPPQGPNVAAVSLWDNFPSELAIPLSGEAKRIHLFCCGSTNAMQSMVVNARFRAVFQDGRESCLDLVPPLNFDDFLIPAFLQSADYFYVSEGTHGIHLVMDVSGSGPLRELRMEAVANEMILMLLGITLER